MQTRRESSPLAQPLAACAGTGVFVGYASLFNKSDASGDVVMPGAFRASLKKRPAQDVRMLFQHNPAEPIGTWIEMTETSRGLYVRGRIDRNVQRGREVFSLLETGGLDGLSIGFRTVKSARGQQALTRHLLAIDLWEVSLVTFPMLAGARVSAVKRHAQLQANKFFTRPPLYPHGEIQNG